MKFESKLIPVLREGVNVVKMIFFKKLQDYLAEKYPDQEKEFTNKLAASLINDLFDTPNPEEPFASFAKANKTIVEEELKAVAANFEDMRIPLTDALRVQVLCGHQEGIDNSAVLARAKDLNILLVERDLPLPHSFMHLVRKLGSAFGLILPPLNGESV